ncbi:hypothetical protein KC333_g2664 [Hortaea werneckii]|nr:hypothetical protein KC333_g2664 [Hortaea werneckii]KAI7316643.1 hypothetical protein KC326_g4294 [Hortaea werneckii]
MDQKLHIKKQQSSAAGILNGSLSEENGEVIREMTVEQRDREQESGRQSARLMGGSVTLNPEMHDASQEVLETSGCETFTGNKGQVVLRCNNGKQAAQPSTAAPMPSSAPLSSAITAGAVKHPPRPQLSAAKLTAEKAAELMHEALRKLPLGDKLVKDKQKPAALAKLDRAFESTEDALGLRRVHGKA